jgi:hypothetical protein
VGHGIVVFPGGAGTAEEILYILSILMHPKNTDVPFPLIFTGPAASAEYFKQIDNFIGETLGPEAQKKYEIIVDSPADVAKRMKQHMETVQAFRRQAQDAYYFNWVLETPLEVQTPFEPTHKQMAELNLTQEQSPYSLAINLRKAFSGIVAGNVKANGIQAIEQHGPYELSGSSNIMNPLSALLESFVEQKRMKIPTSEYKPCYRLV